MRTFQFPVAVFFILIAIQIGFTQELSSTNDAISAIKTVMSNQADGWNEGNLDKYMVGYWNSEKLTFSAGGKTTRGYKQTLARYKSKYDSKEKMGKLTFSGLEISMLGDEAALVLGKWHLKRKSDDPKGNFSVVFQKIDGKWLIVHDHSSSLEE